MRKEGFGPIYLLHICSRIFERLIYDEGFTCSSWERFISLGQSGFGVVGEGICGVGSSFRGHFGILGGVGAGL